MANVVNKTTKQIIKSANTPDFDPSDWLINPASFADVDGHPADHFDIVGDDVVLKSQVDIDSIELEKLKELRFAEIDAKTKALIEAGFTHDGKIFSQSVNSQMNLTGAHNIKDQPIYPISWNVKDDSETYSIVDEAAFDAFYASAIIHRRTQLDSGTALKNSVRAATTITEVNSIIDNR